ncbi:MAG: hypothetical protein U1A72_23220 [Sulfuritalea sp.]|nr:hypothetical protein [Sulfuritalea sp.]
MAGPDLSLLVAVIDYESVVAAVVGVAAAAMWVYVAWFGVKQVLRAVRGGNDAAVSVGVSGYSEAQYREWWDGFDDDAKKFYGVKSYEDWRSRYTAD